MELDLVTVENAFWHCFGKGGNGYAAMIGFPEADAKLVE